MGMEIANLIKGLFAYALFIVVFVLGAKQKAEWTTSIRSIITMILVFQFCAMAGQGRIEAKDFMLIVSLVMNFYFLAKTRPNGESDQSGQAQNTK